MPIIIFSNSHKLASGRGLASQANARPIILANGPVWVINHTRTKFITHECNYGFLATLCFYCNPLLLSYNPLLLSCYPLLLSCYPLLLSCNPLLLSCNPLLLSCYPLLLSCNPLLLSCNPLLLSCNPLLLSCYPLLLSCNPLLLLQPSASISSSNYLEIFLSNNC